MTSNFKNSMYPRSSVRKPKSSNIFSQRKNFVKSVRKQYGNPDSHAFFFNSLTRKISNHEPESSTEKAYINVTWVNFFF